jgi:hypothetical protein
MGEEDRLPRGLRASRLLSGRLRGATLTGMASTKKGFGTMIIIALLLVLLYALNPTMDDFKAWRSGHAEREVSGKPASGLVGVMKKGVGAMTGIASGFYERGDYLLFSTYSLGGKEGNLYLGVARLFVKLR